MPPEFDLATARFFRLASASWFCLIDPALDKGIGAPYACLDSNRLLGTVFLAGAAFHAGIQIGNNRPLIFQHKHIMRAYRQAHPAAVALTSV